MLALGKMSVETKFRSAKCFGDKLNLPCVFAEVAKNVIDALQMGSIVALDAGSQRQAFRSLCLQYYHCLFEGGS